MKEFFNSIDDDALDIVNKIYLKNHQDLNSALYENLLLLCDIDAENSYRELYLDEIQRKVIEEYVDSLKIQKDRAVTIAYVKAIDHTIKYLKKHRLFRKP